MWYRETASGGVASSVQKQLLSRVSRRMLGTRGTYFSLGAVTVGADWLEFEVSIHIRFRLWRLGHTRDRTRGRNTRRGREHDRSRPSSPSALGEHRDAGAAAESQ